MKNMLNFKNFSAEELMEILEIAQDMKKDPDKYAHSLEGKKPTGYFTFLLFRSYPAGV